MTSEYKRVYENGSRYPDVSLSLFSNALLMQDLKTQAWLLLNTYMKQLKILI